MSRKRFLAFVGGLVPIILVLAFVILSAPRGSGQANYTSGTEYSGLSLLANTFVSKAGAATALPHVVYGTCTLGTDCAVTLSGGGAYTGSTTYVCVATDQTSAAATKSAKASGTSVTFTGTSTDVLAYVCVGN